MDTEKPGLTTLVASARVQKSSSMRTSFIRNVVGNPADTGLADAIISMGKNLSLTVVAQGVETREQADFLRTHACDELQGFYFKRPLPADQFAQLLLAQATEDTYIGRPLGLKVV